MDLKTIIEKYNYGIDTNLCGFPFHITAERNIYNAIRVKYKKLALTARDKFEKICNKFKDFDDLIDNTPNAFLQSCEVPLLEVIQDIISIDIYTVDKDTVIDNALNGYYFDEFSESYGEYTNCYDTIMTELEGAEYSRSARRANRPRWQSATFGGTVVSAWSNQLDAAAMNLAEGAAYGIINAIGNAIDRADARAKLNSLFNSKSLRLELINSVYDSCFNLHLLLIELVERYSHISIDGTVSDDDKQKAQAMLNNLVSINLSAEKRGIFINEIFHLNPYKNDFYKALIEKFGDRDSSIGNFSEYHGINIVEIKNEILTEYVSAHLGNTEEEAYRCQQEMENLAEEIGLNNLLINQAQSIINEQLEALDLKYRTVDGIVLITRDEADLAREELPQIFAIMDTIRRANKNDTLSYERDLLSKRQRIDSLVTPVKNKYLQTIDMYLQEFDKVFRKEGFLSPGMSREEAGNQKAYSFVTTFPVGSYEELDYAKDKLIKFLPEVGISQDQAIDAFKYLNECENRLNTVDGVLFASREEANQGKLEYQEINSIMQSISLPDSNSLLPYENHLIETRERLRAFSTPIKEKYITRIQIYLEKFDKKFRTCGFSTYSTREEAAIIRTLIFAKSLSVASYEELEKAKKDVEQFVPLVGILYSQAVSTQEYFHKCYLSLNTVDGIVFQTREEADFGRKELEEILAIMFKVKQPTKNSLLDYERELLDVKEKVNTYQTDIKLKYIRVIEEYLAKFDSLFKQTGPFTKAETREQAAQFKALRLVKSIASPTCEYEDVDKAAQLLKDTLPNLGIELSQVNEATGYLQLQEDRLNTVDGVLFHSREDAKFGLNELLQISQIMTEVAPPTKDSLLNYERNLLAIRKRIEVFETDIKNKYLAIIDDYLLKFDTLFKQTGAFTKAESRQQAAQYKALKLVKSIATSTCEYADVDNARQALNNILPDLGIELNQAFEATRYIQSQEDRLNTVDGVILPTREETQLAKEELSQIQAIMSTVVPPTSVSLLSYEASLKKAEEQLSVFSTPIKNKYLGIVRKYLRDFDDKFRRVSLIKVCATREEAGKERALKFAKSQTYNIIEDVVRVRRELIALLPELGISEEQAEKAFEYLKDTENRLNGIAPKKPKGLLGRFKR